MSTATLTPPVKAIPRQPKTLPAFLQRAAQDWHSDIPYTKTMVLTAKSFQAWMDEMLPVAKGLRPTDNRKVHPSDDRIQVGEWVLRRRRTSVYRLVTYGMFGTELKEPYWEVRNLQLLRSGKRYGEVYFDDEVNIPVLSDAEGKPWMSPTPSEILTQRPGLRAAKGRVLVGGLGLGVAARMIREKKTVRTVTVVDNNPDVIRVFGDIPGVEVVCDDFYRHATANLSSYDSIVADIWKEYGDAGYDSRFTDLKKIGASNGVRVWGWGDYR